MATQQVPTSYKDPFWSDLAANTEQKLGLPSGLLVSVLTRGERSNADQVSEAGARTPFQIIPATRKAVLEKYGIDAYDASGRKLDPNAVNWSSPATKGYSFKQQPGKENPLGFVKINFHNNDAVYMHDTPHKHLFNSSTRTFSYGCIRVRDPVRFAEVLLGHDKGWSPERVRSMVPRGGQITLSNPIPVHTVYFTAVADEDGKLRTLGDLYGADSRVASALEGRSIAVASRGQSPAAEASGSGRVAQRVKGERKQVERRTTTASASNPFAGLFGN